MGVEDPTVLLERQQLQQSKSIHELSKIRNLNEMPIPGNVFKLPDVPLPKAKTILNYIAEQCLGGNNHQGFPPRSHHLPPQQVEILGPCCRLHHLPIDHVCVSLNLPAVRHLQKPLEPAGAVLRPSPIHAVWQQYGKTTLQTPLGLSVGNISVQHDLSTVEEVAKLCLPDDQVVRALNRHTVLKSK